MQITCFCNIQLVHFTVGDKTTRILMEDESLNVFKTHRQVKELLMINNVSTTIVLHEMPSLML